MPSSSWRRFGLSLIFGKQIVGERGGVVQAPVERLVRALVRGDDECPKDFEAQVEGRMVEKLASDIEHAARVLDIVLFVAQSDGQCQQLGGIAGGRVRKR